jgi:hydrogenase expression/formation protein HypE
MTSDDKMTHDSNDRIVLAHGGGGELTGRLLAEHVFPKLGNDLLDPLTDSAVVDIPAGRLCMTTDAFVVQPLEFAGGNIGDLAVCGTVNDLAVMGAVPRALTLALIIEEGLELAVLDRVIDSIAAMASQAGVVVATGDTKVVERGRGDGLMITTAGVGLIRDGVTVDAGRVSAGDAIIITGTIADHGLAVMARREGLAFDTTLASDVAPLNGLIGEVLATGVDVKFMRDPTRSGVAGLLADLAEATGLSIEIDEAAVPITPVARHAAELLGIDPLTVANEGKCVIVVPAAEAECVLAACHAHALGANAAMIGRVVDSQPPLVELVTRMGGRRLIQRPYGEELPRIC